MHGLRPCAAKFGASKREFGDDFTGECFMNLLHGPAAPASLQIGDSVSEMETISRPTHKHCAGAWSILMSKFYS